MIISTVTNMLAFTPDEQALVSAWPLSRRIVVVVFIISLIHSI
jgi:hypothetical protein